MAIPKSSKPPSFNHSIHLEIRLFYVRISPCRFIEDVPDHLTLRHLHHELGVSLEINGSRVPELNPASLTLKRDRIDKETLEVTYVSTDNVRITGGVEFEVLEGGEVILCGSLERMDDNWSNGSVGIGVESNDINNLSNSNKTGWCMDCYVANLGSSGSGGTKSAFSGSPSIEVYIAGCCSRVPVILTKTIQVTSRRKIPNGTLDAIPEDEEIGKEEEERFGIGNGLVRHRSLQMAVTENDEYDSDGKLVRHPYYSDDMYTGEDGELSWFNAGVRVGVGIGLGMCLGIGIGVGLLMRSYQVTTRNFRRRFL